MIPSVSNSNRCWSKGGGYLRGGGCGDWEEAGGGLEELLKYC